MKQIFVGLLIAVLSMGAMAEVGTVGLSEAQKAELEVQAAKMRQDALAQKSGDIKNVSATVRSEAEAWGDLGSNMGKALVGAAKEVGVAANEFAATPLGQVTVAVVVYKVIGQSVIGVLVGVFILLAGLSVAIYLLKGQALYTRSVEYEYKPFLWGMWNRKVIKAIELECDAAAVKLLSAGVVSLVTLIVSLKCIF
jgi:hypothetical protein